MTTSRTFTTLGLILAFVILGATFPGVAQAGTEPPPDGGGISCWLTSNQSADYVSWPSCPSGVLVIVLREECCSTPWYYIPQCSWKQVDSYCLP